MQKQSILVVDDSSTIRKIIDRELSQAGYEVQLANNGMEALAMLEWSNTLPALITLDIDMPRMNGLEVCQAIRKAAQGGNSQKKRIADIPIIFVSANDTVDNREKGYELGVIDFISKPFMPGKMLATVNNILHVREQFSDMTALIVEDSPAARQIVSTILSRHGLTLHEAADGKEALDILAKLAYGVDIIITDYVMPGISGDELCRQLRTMKPLEQVPIFFISSIETKEAILGFFKSGASDYLPKPFTDEEFRARVLTHLRNRKYVKELQKLNQQLSYQADHDGLTGLLNRSGFTRELTTAYLHSGSNDEDLCCLLIDLDHFKNVNDRYGHAFGDLVLKGFADLLKEKAGDNAIVARYGGEEFIVLLPGTSLQEGIVRGKQVVEAAAHHRYNDGARELQVTISLGIACTREHRPQNQDRLLIMADKALYRAKEAGRNRLEIFR